MITVGVEKPEVPFVPVTLKLNTRADLANLLGALLAYGTAQVYAENSLKAIGLGDWYSGNVRKAARDLAEKIAYEVGASAPDDLFAQYAESSRFGQPSQAGSKVIGTDEDLAPNAAPTHFEDGEPASSDVEQDEYDNVA